MANSTGKGFPSTNLQVGHLFADIDDNTLWRFIGGDPRLVTSWVLINGNVNTQPDTSQWGLNQAGALWFYQPERTYYGWNGTERVPIAFSGSPGLYNYQIMFTLQDEFITGLVSANKIGGLGWVTAGTVSIQSSEANAPGIYRFSTGGVSGTIARLSTHQSSAFNPLKKHRILWVVRVNTVDTDTAVRLGSGSSVAGNPPNNGIYFEKLAADTNWFCVLRSGVSNIFRVDSGVAVTNRFTEFMYESDPTAQTLKFYINGVLVVDQVQTTPPAAFIAPYGFIINSAAADKSFDVDYFHMVGQELQR